MQVLGQLTSGSGSGSGIEASSLLGASVETTVAAPAAQQTADVNRCDKNGIC